MKPLTLRTIIFFSLHRSSSSSFLSLLISHFSSSSHSPYTSSSSSSFSPRRQDEQSKKVRVSVWWDYEDCSLPSGYDVFRVGRRITAAIRANGIMGPIEITAFGDTSQLSQCNQGALLSTAIELCDIPHGGKNSCLLDWASYNPPPQHLFLISGDTCFATILRQLRMKNYNILLASPGNAPGILCSDASIVWHWHDLLRGENLTGKHFNQPLDGPYGSWYGHCNVPLEDADNGKSSLPPSPEVNVVEPSTKVQEPPPLGKNIEKVINAHGTEGNLPPVEDDSASEVGFLKRIWRKWFIRNDGASGKKSDGILEECSTSSDSSGKTKSEEERVKSISQSADPVGPASLSLFSNDSALEDRTARSSEVCGDKCSATPGYFSHIINRCKFWSAGPNSNTSRDQSSERLNQINGHPETHEIFSTDSFWSEMESFIDTPKGSVLVSQSKTRLQMAQNLQKQGPLILVSLKESDLLHLVDLLISEKKWVEECPSQTLPFKVTRAIGKSSSLGRSRGSNGLSSIFLGTPSQSDLQRQPELGREKRYQNFPHSETSMPVTYKKPSDRSRSEILYDCQKLVDELFKQYPEGFKMGIFRKLFLERYGYSLDLQKLGYQKLASFLQIMPGVTIESTNGIPSSKVSKGSKTSVPNMKENVI